jgi:negative regulator of sigma E activity
MQPVGAHWVTVMGDVPMGTLKQFAAALERIR